MLSFAPANAMEFLSASSQIFGALLGLLGLAFVRVAEAKENNIKQLASLRWLYGRDARNAARGPQIPLELLD